MAGFSIYFYMNHKSAYEKLLEKYPDAFVPFDDLEKDDREYSDDEASGYYVTAGERNVNELLNFYIDTQNSYCIQLDLKNHFFLLKFPGEARLFRGKVRTLDAHNIELGYDGRLERAKISESYGTHILVFSRNLEGVKDWAAGSYFDGQKMTTLTDYNLVRDGRSIDMNTCIEAVLRLKINEKE